MTAIALKGRFNRPSFTGACASLSGLKRASRERIRTRQNLFVQECWDGSRIEGFQHSNT